MHHYFFKRPIYGVLQRYWRLCERWVNAGTLPATIVPPKPSCSYVAQSAWHVTLCVVLRHTFIPFLYQYRFDLINCMLLSPVVAKSCESRPTNLATFLRGTQGGHNTIDPKIELESLSALGVLQ